MNYKNILDGLLLLQTVAEIECELYNIINNIKEDLKDFYCKDLENTIWEVAQERGIDLQIANAIEWSPDLFKYQIGLINKINSETDVLIAILYWLQRYTIDN